MVHLLLELSPMRHQEYGFTLIELLVVVLIIGILAAVAVTALVNAVQRGRQSRTMADIRNAALAIESYETDHSAFPGASGTIGDIAQYLEPTYIQKVPSNDGWNRPLLFEGTAKSYTIISYGANARPDTPYREGSTSRFRDDLVFVNGQFYQWPEGLQTAD